MTNFEFAEKLTNVLNFKTLYVNGCFGAPLNTRNKTRYTKNNSFNSRADRTKKIMASMQDTFGFDCVCLIKGVLWGWTGDVNATYGGAKYSSNGVSDVNEKTMYEKHCTEHSTDFTKIMPGEFLYTNGHCGVYIGDGKAIECTYNWDDGVQVTEVWNIRKSSGKGRTWLAHGKLNYIEYLDMSTAKDDAEVIVILKKAPTDAEENSIKAELVNLGYEVRIVTEGG